MAILQSTLTSRPSSGPGQGRQHTATAALTVTSGAARSGCASSQLQLSVDVLRFEPNKAFTHYTKTTKTGVSRYEIYAVSCEPLDAAPLESRHLASLHCQAQQPT